MIGDLLLVLGVSAIAGAVRFSHQSFNKTAARFGYGDEHGSGGADHFDGLSMAPQVRAPGGGRNPLSRSSRSQLRSFLGAVGGRGRK